MKQLSKKIIFVVLMLIIVAGTIMVAIKGFNFDLKYEKTNQIKINIGKEFNNNEVKQIAKEVLQTNRVLVQKIEVYDDSVSITAYNISEEQKNAIVDKLKEKYELKDIESKDILIHDIPHTRARDILNPYIIPMAIATAIILVYIAIRYNKLGVFKTIGKTSVIIVFAETVLFSIFAITRLPIGRVTIPIMLLVYIISTIGIATKFENKLQAKKLEEQEE